MSKFLTTSIGRLRLIAILEGISLISLVFIAVPLKRLFGMPEAVKAIGPVHGVLFMLFVAGTLLFSIMNKWSFTKTTWKVLLACIIPFGPFYVDHVILKKIQQGEYEA